MEGDPFIHPYFMVPPSASRLPKGSPLSLAQPFPGSSPCQCKGSSRRSLRGSSKLILATSLPSLRRFSEAGVSVVRPGLYSRSVVSAPANPSGCFRCVSNTEVIAGLGRGGSGCQGKKTLPYAIRKSETTLLKGGVPSASFPLPP